MRLYVRPNTWDGQSGKNGRAIIGAAYWKPKFATIKLLGERVIARDFECWVAELELHAAILNCFTQLSPADNVAYRINLSGV